MILLKELKLNNFLSHENTQISFKDNEKLLIDGRSGAGKSSITEAILWALYGKGRSDNRSLVRRGSKTGSVSIKFFDGEFDVLITRSTTAGTGKNGLDVTRNTGPNGQFLPIERTGLKDRQNWIEKEFLKASYELFTNSVAYPQENENSFVKATATRRKDLLLEIIGASNFDELYEKTRKVIQNSQTESAVNLSKVSGLIENISNSKALAEKHDLYKVEEEQISQEIDEAVKKEKGLEDKIKDFSSINSKISDKKKLIDNFNTSINSTNFIFENGKKTLEEYNSIDIEAAQKNVAEAVEISKEIETIEKELKDNAIFQSAINSHLANKPTITDYSKDIFNINRQLIPLIKDSSKCPAGESCPFIVPIKGQISFLEEQIKEKTIKNAKEEIALRKWQKEHAQLTPVKDTSGLYEKLVLLRSKVDTLNKSKDVITKHGILGKTIKENKENEVWLTEQNRVAREKIVEIEGEIKVLQEELIKFDVNKTNTDLSNIRIFIQKLRKSKEEVATNISISLKAKEYVKTASTELEVLNSMLSKGQEDVDALEILKEALSPRGIKAVVIDYLVPQLEDKINAVLSQMSDFRIRLDTQAAKADDDGVKEGLFITVINDLSEELAFTNYSGGEKVKITIAISEALASLMNQIGFRIMDENIVSLDKESTEGFVVILEQLQSKFPQLLIISHLQEVKDMFEKKVEIIKVNGISKIV